MKKVRLSRYILLREAASIWPAEYILLFRSISAFQCFASYLYAYNLCNSCKPTTMQRKMRIVLSNHKKPRGFYRKAYYISNFQIMIGAASYFGMSTHYATDIILK